MGKHSAFRKDRRGGGLLLGAMASGALAVTALSGAGTANATCTSISGISTGSGCTSDAGSIAIGIGPDATASATGTSFAFAIDGTQVTPEPGTLVMLGTGIIGLAGILRRKINL